jgi:hypothetical protein
VLSFIDKSEDYKWTSSLCRLNFLLTLLQQKQIEQNNQTLCVGVEVHACVWCIIKGGYHIIKYLECG